MAKYNLLLPRMGESISEATIVKWLKQVGDYIEIDETVIEIATDKVDSDVPSPVAGKLVTQFFNEADVVQVGDVIAILEVEGEQGGDLEEIEGALLQQEEESVPTEENTEITEESSMAGSTILSEEKTIENSPVSDRFFSPLVKSIAQEEGISLSELESINGSGLEGRVTKQDILQYIAVKKESVSEGTSRPVSMSNTAEARPSSPQSSAAASTPPVVNAMGDEIVEMDRMRKMIADHMTNSVKTSAHVTSFLEADVTNIVNWRNKNKVIFEKREGTKITFTPIFIEAIAKAIRDFPMINVSVDGTQIIKKSNINIGMAAALPTGNLIVPVIKNADQLNLVGISKAVNDLAQRARTSKLKPDEVQGGTFTITNIGSFGNLMGTPIINQPQVAILAVGAIVKKPAVVETEYGDMIGIRHKMYLSLSYDHRVVDGALGGMFIRRVADYLEAWDITRLV